jgi:hypothetical protein
VDRRDLDEPIATRVSKPTIAAQDAIGIAHAVPRRAPQLEVRLDCGDHRATSGHGWAMRPNAPLATSPYARVVVA